jgi:hypothetical protein
MYALLLFKRKKRRMSRSQIVEKIDTKNRKRYERTDRQTDIIFFDENPTVGRLRASCTAHLQLQCCRLQHLMYKSSKI